ncbi:MAG: endonuclease/exonuclease/phosphatase family protein [Deltaproteobacteria bacterium]|nr:endonuclease/exonuclease/phosphatase family protein [Deltaproteobacteria bacterium]
MLASLAALALLGGCASMMNLRSQPSTSVPAKVASSNARPLRVVSFNVHLGEFLKYEREGHHASIERSFRQDPRLRSADIIGLQELCSDEGGWQVDYFHQVMKDTAGQSYVATALSDPIGKMMCARVEAIYSRFPIVNQGVITLPQVFEPRSAVWADIDVPNLDGQGTTRVRVYNAHLENRPQNMSWEEGRLKQIRVVLDHVDAWRAAHPGEPLILLGDLNTVGRIWDPWRREATIKAIEADQLQASIKGYHRTLTFTPHQIDWIFFNDQLALKHSEVVGVWLSDHFPLVADFTLAPAKEASAASAPPAAAPAPEQPSTASAAPAGLRPSAR